MTQTTVGGWSIRHVTELVSKLRTEPPRLLRYTMSPLVADEVVAAWREDVEEKMRVTEADYRKIAARFVRQCAEISYNGDVDQVSPLDVLELLFDKAPSLAGNSWTIYRSAILFHLDEAVTSRDEMRTDSSSHRKALATLIVVSTRRLLTDKVVPPTVERFLTENECQLLFRTLASSTASLAPEALAFAAVTLRTGVRPCEWRSAQLAPACIGTFHRDLDRPDPTLVVTCGKQKSGQPRRQRTLILATVSALIDVQTHMRYMDELFTADSEEVTGRLCNNRIDKCSLLIRSTCQKLWSNKPAKWLSLTDFRDQARANFVEAFGTPIATALMGHGSEVGRKHYAPKRRAYSSRGMAEVLPGPDVLAHSETLHVLEPMDRIQEVLRARSEAIDLVEVVTETG